MSRWISLEPLGDRGFLARFADESQARVWARAVRVLSEPEVVDVVPAYVSVAVFADPKRVDLDTLEARLRAVGPEGTNNPAPTGALIRLPVLYDGPDLADVARRCGLTPDDVVTSHSGTEYTVFALGFRPGFPYSGYLPLPLTGLARRSEPRARVSAGSVAIAGRQTGVYPCNSPGGWHILGRTPITICDVRSAHFPIEVGDRIRFEPITPQVFDDLAGSSLQRPSDSA